MKKTVSSRLLLALCSALFVTACSSRTEVEKGDTYIYCLNTDRTGLVKVTYDFEGESTLEKAEGVLAELKRPADEIEYTAPIPEKLDVLGCSLGGSILEVNFSDAYAELGDIEEKLVRASVVRSLVQISGIGAVGFTVEGRPLEGKDGRLIGLMNEDDFVGTTGSSPSSYVTDTFRLYFADKSGEKLVAQEASVKYSSNISREKLIVEKLMQGPKGSGAGPTINPEANLLGVTMKDGVCYVSFDRTFLTGAYDILPELTIYSIVNSLIEGTDAVQVQITINGESNAKYMDKIDLSLPLDYNMEWITTEE